MSVANEFNNFICSNSSPSSVVGQKYSDMIKELEELKQLVLSLQSQNSNLTQENNDLKKQNETVIEENNKYQDTSAKILELLNPMVKPSK